jgi:hypothetical protein
MTPHTVDYLLSWLVGEDFARFIGYTDDEARFADYRVVILPSWHIGGALPHLPLAEIEGIPLLFGEPHVSRRGDTLVVHADVIASTFFLVSRYEELARPRERDEHGRFPGRSSLPCCAGFIHRPVADAYGALLRRWLREVGVPVPADRPSLQNLYLTHDVDGHLHAALFIVLHGDTAYCLAGGCEPAYRHTHANCLLLFDILQSLAGRCRRFDFEGSMMRGVEGFNREFGAIQTPYFSITKGRLTFLRRARIKLSRLRP